MRARTIDGAPLRPGVNVDAVDIDAGLEAARWLGFKSAEDVMVATYALKRHARGEEDGAVKTWLSYFPHSLIQWYVIIAHAVAPVDTQP